MLFNRMTVPGMLLIMVSSFSLALGHCRFHDNCNDSSDGSSIFISPQMVWLDNGPLKDLIKKESSLRGRSFDLDHRSPVFTLGFGGIHDHGHGVRTGFSIYAGYKSTTSESFTGGKAPDTLRDSVVMLRQMPAFGGFLFEKAFKFYDVTFIAGTMVGGGVFILHRQFYDVEESGAFTSTYEDTSDYHSHKNRDDRNWAFAPAFTFDLHAGVSFPLSPLLHLGVEAVALCFYSPEGYGYATGEFFTVSPGLRIRLNLGRAG
jgi:hypothetical protein